MSMKPKIFPTRAHSTSSFSSTASTTTPLARPHSTSTDGQSTVLLALEQGHLVHELSLARKSRDEAKSESEQLKRNAAVMMGQLQGFDNDIRTITNASAAAQIEYFQKELERERGEHQATKFDFIAFQRSTFEKEQRAAEDLALLKKAHADELSSLRSEISSLQQDIHMLRAVDPHADTGHVFWNSEDQDPKAPEEVLTSPRLPATSLMRLAVFIDLGTSSIDDSRLTHHQRKLQQQKHRILREAADGFGRYGVQVFNIAAAGPERCFEELAKIPDVRIIVVGDDQMMRRIITAANNPKIRSNYSKSVLPPLVPLLISGTGVKCDLEASLGWGRPWPLLRLHVSKDISEFLEAVENARSVVVDRWKISITDQTDNVVTKMMVASFAVGKEACGLFQYSGHPVDKQLSSLSVLYDRLTVNVDGDPIVLPQDTVSIAVVNTGSFVSYTGKILNFSASKEARATLCGDGFLDVIAFTSKGKSAAVSHGKRVTIIPSKIPLAEQHDLQYYMVDGEVWAALPLQIAFEMIPNNIQVLHTREYSPKYSNTLGRAIQRKMQKLTTNTSHTSHNSNNHNSNNHNKHKIHTHHSTTNNNSTNNSTTNNNNNNNSNNSSNSNNNNNSNNNSNNNTAFPLPQQQGAMAMFASTIHEEDFDQHFNNNSSNNNSNNNNSNSRSSGNNDITLGMTGSNSTSLKSPGSPNTRHVTLPIAPPLLSMNHT